MLSLACSSCKILQPFSDSSVKTWQYHLNLLLSTVKASWALWCPAMLWQINIVVRDVSFGVVYHPLDSTCIYEFSDHELSNKTITNCSVLGTQMWCLPALPPNCSRPANRKFSFEFLNHESNQRLQFESNQGVVVCVFNAYCHRSCVGLVHTTGNYPTACYVVVM